MKKLSFLFIILALLGSCAINNNFKDERKLFCSSEENKNNKYVLKLESNNVFEIEQIVRTVGIRHYYCKGKWSYISKKRIIFECDKITYWDRETYSSPPLDWNTNSNKEYIKMISKNKVILFIEGYKKIILMSDWCDCIQEHITPIIKCE